MFHRTAGVWWSIERNDHVARILAGRSEGGVRTPSPNPLSRLSGLSFVDLYSWSPRSPPTYTGRREKVAWGRRCLPRTPPIGGTLGGWISTFFNPSASGGCTRHTS